MSIDSKSRANQPSGPVQPYLDWAVETQFAYLREGDWLPLLVEFDPSALELEDAQTPLQAFTSLTWLAREPRTLDNVLRISELLTNPPRLLAQSKRFNFCVVFLHRERFAEVLESAEWKKTIRRVELGPPVMLADIPSSVQAQEHRGRQ
jgi:hypothetical protein